MMYCKYCGRLINDDSKYCPYCGGDLKQEAPVSDSKNKKLHKEKYPRFLIPAILVIASALICIALNVLFGFGKKNNVVKENANAVAEAFNNTDMASINKILFNENEIEADNEFNDQTEEGAEEVNEGVLEGIFKYVTVKVVKITDNSIEYKIKAPDMTNVFADLNVDTERLSESELLHLINEYAANTDTREEITSLHYSTLGGQLIVDYRDESFINAVTGGFLDAYLSLYNDMINEIAEGER